MTDPWTYSDQYAAGFFDGEGCIQIYERPGSRVVSYNLNLILVQIDRRPLDAIKERFGGRIAFTDKAGRRRCHRWRASAGQGVRFLEAVLPYLLVKREQAELALKVTSLLTARGRRLSDEEIHHRKEAYDAFRKTFER